MKHSCQSYSNDFPVRNK